MPWTSSEFNSNHLGGNASAAQARRGAAAANNALKSCLAKGRSRDYCEGYAVRVGKAAAKKGQVQEMDGMESFADRELRRSVFGPTQVQEAVWTTAYVNNLPDSAFLYVASGGKKDSEGKTVPRSLRKFPYKDAAGKVDLPHIRNAIARIPQAKGISAETKARLQARARGILERAS